MIYRFIRGLIIGISGDIFLFLALQIPINPTTIGISTLISGIISVMFP